VSDRRCENRLASAIDKSEVEPVEVIRDRLQTALMQD
jgi:hypothetical protein